MTMDLGSRLDAVTVYSRGAVCVRRAALTQGSVASVRLTGLPLSLRPGSLRARVEKASATQRVLDVRAGFEVKLPEVIDVPTEQKALEAAQATLEQHQQDLARVTRDISELQSLRPDFPKPQPGQPPRPAPVSALLTLSDFTATELSARFEKKRALQQKVEDAQRDVELHQRRIAESSTANRPERVQLQRTAVVTLAEAPSEGAEMVLEYFVPGARWVPSYDLRLQPGMVGGALTMRASVAQRSGEDWSNVKLALSTAALDRRTELPELRSLRIGREQPEPPRSGWREPPAGLEELFEGFDDVWTSRVVALPPPPPPPMPMPQSAPMQKPRPEKAKKMASAPMEMASLGGAVAAGPAMAMPPPAPKAAMRSRGGPPGAGGASMDRRRGMAVEEVSAEMAFDEAAPEDDAYDDDEGSGEYPTGSFGAVSLAEPEAQRLEPGAGLLDYDRLQMPANNAFGSRGRLQPVRDEQALLLSFMAVSVQVDVVMAMISTASQRANDVSDLPMPRGTSVPTGGSFDYRYDCAHRVDVPSSGQWTVVNVADADVGLQAEYSCVPSVEPQVYRTLKVHNRSVHALLTGPVDVSVGDEFLLTAELPLIAPGAADARLGLGVEEAIKVARKTHFKETTGGLLGGSTVLPHEIEIEVSNRTPSPATIEVRERVPVSDEVDVKIEESQVAPPWVKDEKPRDGVATAGARAWKLTLQPGEKQTLSAQYVIRIPSDKMLVGGNRRV